MVCLGFIAAGSFALNDVLYYSPDSAHYLGWARSLANLEGFKLTFTPEPFRYVANAPLYPMVLAPVARLFPLDVTAAKAVTLAFGAILIIVFYRLLASITTRTLALAGCFLLSVNSLHVLYSTQVLSDIPFAVTLVLFLLLATRLQSETTAPPWTFPAFAATVCCGIFLREVGFVLLISAVTLLAARRDHRHALITAIICLFVYLLWYVRNEVIVAGIEDPVVRNTRFFFSRVVLPEDASLAAEFVTRLKTSVLFYGPIIGRLLFIPQYRDELYEVIQESDPLLSAAQTIVGFLHIPIVAITLGGAVHGFFLIGRSPRTRLITLPLVITYIVVVAFYPTTDIRYLFPLLLLMLYAFMVSVARFHTVLSRGEGTPGVRFSRVLAGLCLLLAVPNAVWMQNFLRANDSYRTSSAAFSGTAVHPSDYPAEFSRPFPLAMQWIRENTDSSAVIGSNYRQAGLWSGGRKIVPLSPLFPLQEFEGLIQDYGVSHLLSLRVADGLHEFDMLTAFSRRYCFVPAFRAGDIEILKVDQRGGELERIDTCDTERRHPGQDGVRETFMRAIRLLRDGKSEGAFSVLQDLRRQPLGRASSHALFYSAVAAELSFRLDTADELFARLRQEPQAFLLLQQARDHQQTIEVLRILQHEPDPLKRALICQSVAVKYWQLGFPRQAMSMLRRSLATDSSYLPSLLLGVVFGLQGGDTSAAASSLASARRAYPGDSSVRSFERVLEEMKDIRAERDTARRIRALEKISQELLGLGLNELATDHARAILKDDPNNIPALRVLGKVLMRRERYAPAHRILSQLARSEPENGEVSQALEYLRRRL